MDVFKRLLDSFLDLFFPMQCIHCGKMLSGEESFLCSNCENELPLTYFSSYEDNYVTKIFWGRLPIKYGFSYMHFVKHSVVQSVLYNLKYNEKQDLALYMGEKIGLRLKENNFPEDIDLLLPVPLHPKKLRLRGYNQSEYLARGIAKFLNKPVVTDSVIRTVFTPSQTKLSKEERWRNVENIFKVVKPRKLKGKHIVMIDDVLTTGATLESLGQVLLELGDVNLSFITLATAKNI